MDCPTCESLIEAYADGELSADVAVALEAALPQCPDCQRRLEQARGLRAALRAMPPARAPAALRAAIVAAVPSASATVAEASVTRLPQARVVAGLPRRDAMRWAASIVVALGAGWGLGRYALRPDRDDTGEIVAGYLRVASSDRPTDVASSDRHTVKPWFNGKLDYAPPVHDLTTDGFPLVGGRLDVIGKHGKVAVLIYQRNRHLIALFIWPDKSDGAAKGEVRDGFGILRWSRAGFAFRAIGDVSLADLERLAAAFDAKV